MVKAQLCRSTLSEYMKKSSGHSQILNLLQFTDLTTVRSITFRALRVTIVLLDALAKFSQVKMNRFRILFCYPNRQVIIFSWTSIQAHIFPCFYNPQSPTWIQVWLVQFGPFFYWYALL